ncbi:preprotein translocase subunit SecY [Candidatus Nomurabacteria bacterium RIFCSPLOWO2_01_FULL_33_24]|uniref:Protein translocase subunit SecY n=1 Tax=Candidatus Nomurabacteria bacterium RIFCSPLOWO2_01_FULL_33_24 TaxID=1801765 RepID=A0A1F6X233_9BACT|nr:MAG: preprotein translocase subunit SecY [Candidatus Nomurabacteria bacterium RIFCSPLOWO2_01_FULL_33_24]
MQNFLHKTKIVLLDKNLRNKILFVLLALIIFRIFAAIPIPGVDSLKLEQYLSNNQFLGILNIFSGGGLSSLSIVMLGVGPYITASIILQLLTIMIPKLKALYHEEGDAGRKKFIQYSRILTVPLAAIQGFALISLLQQQDIIAQFSLFNLLTNLLVVVGGSILIMWLGELISEYGIGNGVSMIIFAGIVAYIPSQLGQLIYTFDVSQLTLYIGALMTALLIIIGVVIVSEGERPIPITYARRVRGSKVYGGVSTYLPLRINQAGVMPIIFALSLLLFPQMIANFFIAMEGAVFQKIGSILNTFSQTTWLYTTFYFILVFLFTYFYTAVTFDPKSLATNLQKSGAFIPGIRPGPSTVSYIDKILNRITLMGALFLGLIAVLPLIMKTITGITALAIGGTALLIVVSVVLDLMKKVDAQISMREY